MAGKLTDNHSKHMDFLNEVQQHVEDNWITRNAAQMSDETTQLLRKAIKFAFHAGASAMDQRCNMK